MAFAVKYGHAYPLRQSINRFCWICSSQILSYGCNPFKFALVHEHILKLHVIDSWICSHFHRHDPPKDEYLYTRR